jgi:hypothetical protein
VRAQQPVEHVDQVLLHIRAPQVEDQLVAQQRGLARRKVDRPVRVRAVEVAVRVDHLRLQPEAEIHAQRVDPLDQRLDAVGEFAGVGPPVAQARVVDVAAVEPAVVHHKEFHAHLRRDLGHGDLRRLVHIEEDRLPGVVEHRVKLLAVRQQIIAHMVVEDARGRAETARRVAGQAGRRGEGRPRFQPPGEVPVVDAQADARRAEVGHLRREFPIAAPCQHAEPDLALHLVRAAAIYGEPGLGVVAGGDAPALFDLDAGLERFPLQPPLVQPTPRQV